MINYKLKINFQDEKILSSDITFVSGDISAYKLIFDFYDNGKKVDASKYTLTVKAKRSDGVKIASAGTIEDGQAVFVPESNIYAVPGDLYLEIALCDATGKYITTKIIIATVIEGLGETDVKGTEVPSVYVTLLSKLQYQIDQANQLVNESIPVKGEDYFDGKDGIDGKDGYTPVKGVDYFDGKDGIDGKDGVDGKDGYTPVKGVDYFTEEEKKEFVSELDTRIEDVNKSIDEIKTNAYGYSNAVKGFCKGELIRSDDVSPNKHTVKCKTSVPIRVSGKNMISYPYAMSEKTSNGITFTVNQDSTITVKGTATANVGFTIVSIQQNLKAPVGTYCLSGCPAGGSEDTYYLQAVLYKENVYQTQFRDIGSGARMPISAIDRGDVAIQITIVAGTELPDDGITFKPQFEVGSNASEYEPATTALWYAPDDNNMVEFVSKSTRMTIITDTKGVEAECEYNRDTNKVIGETWELISSGELTEEVSQITLDSFSCSKVELKIAVAHSANNSEESSMRVRTNVNSNTGGGSDSSLTRMFRKTGTNTPAIILLEMYHKTITGTLVNSGVTKQYVNWYANDPSISEYDSITRIYLAPVNSGAVFGVGTTYELWGVRK